MRCSVDGVAFPNPRGSGMVDDIASFVPAHMFAEFALPFFLHLNRQDRVLRMEGRTYLLASDRKGRAPCVFFLTDES